MSHSERAPLRVAAYCRVSTDKEDQLNSLAAQRRFFQEYIADHPAWAFAGIFADEGLSGTSVKRRPQFAELVQRAMAGGIDLILTKEVSRFARNTVDALQITRQLKGRGVGVLFLNDNIDTRENDGEFRLTIMASVAQEESRKVSERTRWGQLQAMKRGVAFGNNSLYGYTLSGGRLTIQPEQAEVVRAVYRKFLTERKGSHIIARELTESGVRPPLRSGGPWSSAMVLRLLKNEKYCGDLLQKKYRTTDYLTHRKIVNDGAEEQFCLRDHHEAIVSRSQFQAVQEELARRSCLTADRSRFSARYWYSGKIRCGACGRSLTLKRTRRPDGTEYRRFVCRGRLEGGGGCQMRAVRAEELFACTQYVLERLALDRRAMLEELLGAWRAWRQPDGTPEKIRQALRRQGARRERAVEAFLDGDLDRAVMHRVISRCEGEMQRLEAELAQWERSSVTKDEAEIRARLERELEDGDAFLDEAVQRVTVYPEDLLVEVAELPVQFRVRAEGRGTGAEYTVAVRACLSEPRERE